jgi:hypothetical protein
MVLGFHLWRQHRRSLPLKDKFVTHSPQEEGPCHTGTCREALRGGQEVSGVRGAHDPEPLLWSLQEGTGKRGRQV